MSVRVRTNADQPAGRALRVFLCACVLAALGACGEESYDPSGEGVRRYGALPDEEGGFGGSALEEGAAEKAAPVAPTGTKPPPRQPKGAGGRRRTGGKYEVIEVADGGTLRGVVRVKGPLRLKDLEVQKDQAKCGHADGSLPSERIVAGPTGTLANCLVYLADIKKGKAWAGPMAEKKRKALLDQKGCVYIPHVQAVRVKTQLAVKNSDPAEHNIHGFYNSYRNTAFNFITSANSTDAIEAGAAYLRKAGKYIVKCDIHPWMSSYVWVMSHPYYAVTDMNGTYELTNVPPGTYQLVCWHEGMQESPSIQNGEITGYSYGNDWEEARNVTVAAGETVEADFEVVPPQ